MWKTVTFPTVSSDFHRLYKKIAHCMCKKKVTILLLVRLQISPMTVVKFRSTIIVRIKNLISWSLTNIGHFVPLCLQHCVAKPSSIRIYFTTLLKKKTIHKINSGNMYFFLVPALCTYYGLHIFQQAFCCFL